MDTTVSKEEKAHLNQLVRDFVQGDANLPYSNQVDSNDGFDQIPYIVKQVFQVDIYWPGVSAGHFWWYFNFIYWEKGAGNRKDVWTSLSRVCPFGWSIIKGKGGDKYPKR